MFILRNILIPLQHEFKVSRKGPERGTWFIYTLLAVITHFTSSRTSNLIRCLQTLFGFTLCPHRFYTFMASSKIPWDRLWTTLWSLIPQPTVNTAVSCWPWTITSTLKRVKRSLLVRPSSIMPPRSISPNTLGHKTWCPLVC